MPEDGARFGKVRTLEGEVEIGAEVTNREDEVGDTGMFDADAMDACHICGLRTCVCARVTTCFSSLDDTRTCTDCR